MKFIDLFAGIGGFRLGLENIRPIESKFSKRPETNNSTKDKLVKWECIYSNEWDKYARQVYEKHWGECDGRDIREVPTEEIPDHDLLCAGFPCQSFSIAGQRKGFQDTRGTLFFDICRILKDKRPSYLLLENVKGLLSHQDGWTFATMLLSLDELGYDVEWQVLNSKHFGVPQNRERVFIVGCLRGRSSPKVFPINQDDEVSTQRQGQISPAITSRYFKQGQSDPYVIKESEATIRKLTPIECERLQGFPDNWTQGVSDTQRYKMLGNAVTVNVIQAIGERLRKTQSNLT